MMLLMTPMMGSRFVAFFPAIMLSKHDLEIVCRVSRVLSDCGMLFSHRPHRRWTQTPSFFQTPAGSILNCFGLSVKTKRAENKS